MTHLKETQILNREYKSAANRLKTIKGMTIKGSILDPSPSRLVSSRLVTFLAGITCGILLNVRLFDFRSARDTRDCCLCRDIEADDRTGRKSAIDLDPSCALRVIMR
jgi:hypothetical protein